jgi:Flp pilus assembly protein TadB
MGRPGDALRVVGAIVVAVATSVVLVAAFGWWTVRSDDMRLVGEVSGLAKDGQTIPAEKTRAFWSTLEQGRTRTVWLVCPGIAFLTGAVAGALSGRRRSLSGLLGTSPFAATFSFGVQGLIGAPLLVLYLSCGAGAAWLLGRMLDHRVESRGRPTME